MTIYKALGFMSGTSMDGVDAAVIETDGTRVYGHGKAVFMPYEAHEIEAVTAALGQWQGDDVKRAENAVMAAHNRALVQFDVDEYDVIGFHGQTIAHEPRARKTLQIGNPDSLKTNAPVVYDFRTQDVLAGGEGAPLIPIYHHALAQDERLPSSVLFLNIGGVANVTYVDKTKPVNDEVIAFDTGTGNAVIDDIVAQKTGARFDKDGEIAAKGVAELSVLKAFFDDTYFQKMPPKSLDRNSFHSKLMDLLHDLPLETKLATAVEATVGAISKALIHLPQTPEVIVICGGGRKNKFMMKRLYEIVDIPLLPMDALSMDGDMIEAEGFAFLAARRLKALPSSFPMTTGVPAPMIAGKIFCKGDGA